ncbi:MAG: M23 family metallopeptidase [Spirochaetaceae bacterium]|nr:MAG: M23 family metallopeptidase [Spirochaetaceae bacterium]
MITLSILLLATCRQEIVDEQFQPAETWEEYRQALTQLDLSETVMGAAWISAGQRALAEPTGIEAPLEEVLYFDPHRPDAVSYRFPLRRGRRVRIEIETDTERYFADLFRVPAPEDNREEPVLVASRPERGDRIELEARRDRFYLLRIQPELLRGGRFRVRIIAEASLAFPVEGVGPERILSFYGDSRGGGSRIHEGVDIFAPRGTPLLATSDAVVFRVGWRDRGGNIVSLRDEERDLMIYYAHLEEQLVTTGQRVSAGDVIGTVGNTGNAIHTPPHLHIGIYQGGWRGAVDPWEYLVDPAVTEPPPVEDPWVAGAGAGEARAAEAGAADGAPEASREAEAGAADGAPEASRWFRLGADARVERYVPPLPAAPRYVNRNPFLFAPGTAAISERGLREIPTPFPAARELSRDTAVQVVGSVSGRDSRVRVRTVRGETWVVRREDLVPNVAPGGGGASDGASSGAGGEAPGTIPVYDMLSGDVIARVDPTAPGELQVLGLAGLFDSDTDKVVVALASGRVGLATAAAVR